MVILLLELSCDYLHLSRQIGQLRLWCARSGCQDPHQRVSTSPPPHRPVTTNMEPLQWKLWCRETHDTTHL